MSFISRSGRTVVRQLELLGQQRRFQNNLPFIASAAVSQRYGGIVSGSSTTSITRTLSTTTSSSFQSSLHFVGSSSSNNNNIRRSFSSETKSSEATATATAVGGEEAQTEAAQPEVPQYDSPLELIHSSTNDLKEFGERLENMSDQVNSLITLSSGRKVTLKDVVLHSRDSSTNEFHSDAAKEAREMALPIAETIENEMKELSNWYYTSVVTKMGHATMVCKDLRCGGASFEMDFQAMLDNNQTELRMEGKDTPCGRLNTQSLEFLETTYKTKHSMILGSRAALILRLAHKEFNEPLNSIRDDQRKRIGEVFTTQNIPTPWIRSNEEYDQYFKMKAEQDNENAASKNLV